MAMDLSISVKTKRQNPVLLSLPLVLLHILHMGRGFEDMRRESPRTPQDS